jgi:hypothetical protein
MRAAFLLGSGISRDAGMPGVEQIGEQVFGGHGVIRHTDSTYYLDAAEAASNLRARSAAEPAIAFAGRLRGLADRYFTEVLDGRQASYEDVANLAKQIDDAISGEYENPGLLPALDELVAEQESEFGRLQRLAQETRAYIRDTVWRMLDRPLRGVDHLAAIVDGCRDLGTLDLVELNHDRVLEAALAGGGVRVSDGFTGRAGDVAFWTDEFDAPIRHLRLHGSIDWFGRRLPEEEWRGNVVARSNSNDPYHDKGTGGELLELPTTGRPVLLTGTFDKPLGYDGVVFADQHFRFHEALREARALIVIGYGFRDKAINNRLIGWMNGRFERRLVVVHAEPARLLDKARAAVARESQRWSSDGRVRQVAGRIAEVGWDQIAAQLR